MNEVLAYARDQSGFGLVAHHRKALARPSLIQKKLALKLALKLESKLTNLAVGESGDIVAVERIGQDPVAKIIEYHLLRSSAIFSLK